MADAANRKKIIEALLTLLAEQPIERIGLGDIATAAGVSLADLRDEFSSVLSILAAHMKEIDRQVLASDTSDMSEEPVRERLFDILMRRLEAHAPHKAAIRSLMKSSLRNPPLALALNSFAARSMSWMMTAAGISTAGPRGIIRAQALTLFYARVVATWAEDEDPGLAQDHVGAGPRTCARPAMVGLARYAAGDPGAAAIRPLARAAQARRKAG